MASNVDHPRTPKVHWAHELGANLLAALGIVLAIALIDLRQASTLFQKISVVFVLGGTFALAFLAAMPGVALFSTLRRWARPFRGRRVVVGLVDSALVAILVFLVEKYDSVSMPILVTLAISAILVRVLVALLPPESWWIVLAKWALTFACVGFLLWMPWRQKPVMRVTMDFTLAMLAGALLWRKIARLPSWCVWGTVAGISSVAIAFGIYLRPKLWLRRIVIDGTTQGKATLQLLADHCPDCLGHSRSFGPVACGAAPGPTCHAKRLTAPSRLSGAARGADILVITFDSLRADLRDEFKPLFSQLGGTLEFTNAFSTAPGTRLAFGSIWRGRSVRRVPFEKANPFGGVTLQSASKTFPTALTTNGYRAVVIASHRFVNPAAGLSTGFELVYVKRNQIPLDAQHIELNTVSIKRSFDRGIKVAEETDKPLLLWTHAFESHFPYGGRRQQEEQTQEGQRRAVRRMIPIAQKYVERFRAARRDRPLVVIVFGDHGEEFGEHGGRHHSSTVYREQTQVVFAMSGPGLVPGTVASPVSLAALPATLSDWLGHEIPCDFDIPSILGCAEDATRCPSVVEASTPREGGQFAYTNARDRLLSRPSMGIVSFYDVTRDPFDRNPLEWSEGDAARIAIRKATQEYDRTYCTTSRSTGGD